jgi:hypothetical protein
MNLESDEMLLGMPFLAAYNPDINWQDGTFSEDIIALTDNAHQWTSNKHKTYNPEKEEEDLKDQDYKFISSNEHNIITIGKVTTATELAIYVAGYARAISDMNKSQETSPKPQL